MICILICILLTIDILSSCNRCNAFLKDNSPIHNKIRLMVFNINHENQIKNFEILLELILFEKPDIILFQEVSPQAQEKLKSMESFFQYKIGPKNPASPFASIILSNYALKENKEVDHFAISTNVIIDGMELKIIGYHLLYYQSNITPTLISLYLQISLIIVVFKIILFTYRNQETDDMYGIIIHSCH